MERETVAGEAEDVLVDEAATGIPEDASGAVSVVAVAEDAEREGGDNHGMGQRSG